MKPNNRTVQDEVREFEAALAQLANAATQGNAEAKKALVRIHRMAQVLEAQAMAAHPQA